MWLVIRVRSECLIDRIVFFFFKQKTAYEIGTGDWSSDVCSSDLKELAASKVLATVTLEYQPTSEEYVLSDDSIAKITDLSPDCETETNQVAPTPRQREPSITDCLRSEVRPLPGSRSQRVRTVISYPYQ